MIVLDATAMIAVLDPHDAHFAAAREVFRANSTQRVVAHRLTVAESLVVAARSNLAARVASAFDALGIGRLDEPDDPVALAELRARTGLRMPDACVLLAAHRDGAALATFDERLAHTARDEGITVLGLIS
ncbi:MAG: PIN domain-containing protein [Rhodoglobus sp.]